MSSTAPLETWLKGPVPGIPGLLQPVAHALIQVRGELETLMEYFPESRLWDRPAGVASPAFHLQHLTGVLDRLFTYAAGNKLNTEQFSYLAQEGKNQPGQSLPVLLSLFNQQVERSLLQLRQTSQQTLLEPREVVVPACLPLIGFAVSCSGTLPHLGQLLVTVRNIKAIHRTGIMKQKILVTKAFFPDIIEKLKIYFDVEVNSGSKMTASQLHEALKNKEGVLVAFGERMDASVIEGCAGLKAVCVGAAGYNNIDKAGPRQAPASSLQTPRARPMKQ